MLKQFLAVAVLVLSGSALAEPATIATLGLGLLSVFAIRGRRKRFAAS